MIINMITQINDVIALRNAWFKRKLYYEELFLEDYERPLTPDNLKHFKPKVKILSYLLP